MIPDMDISAGQIIDILVKKGFLEPSDKPNIIKIAREFIGKSKYKKGARMSKAPTVIDCSSFIKWLYGLRGIWLPRNLFLWQTLGEAVDVDKATEGDIIFTTDRNRIGINHVGLVSQPNTMIHATNYVGVQEIPFKTLMEQRSICMIRRIIPANAHTFTFLLPEKAEIETSDDIEWLIRRSLRH